MQTKTKKKKNLNIKFYLNTRRELVYALLALAFSTLLIFVVVIPQSKNLLKQTANLKKENLKSERLRKKVAELDSLKVSADVQKLEILDEVLPKKKPLLEIMTQLNNLSKITGVTIKNLELSPGEISDKKNNNNGKSKIKRRTKSKVTGLNQLDIKLSVSGTFNQVKEFMNLLEKTAPFTTINSFSVSGMSSSNSDKKDENETSLQLEISTYFYEPPALTAKTTKSKQSTDIPELTNKDLKLLDTLTQFKLLTEPIDIDNSIRVEDLFKATGWGNLEKEDQEEIKRYLESQLQPSPSLPPSPPAL